MCWLSSLGEYAGVSGDLMASQSCRLALAKIIPVCMVGIRSDQKFQILEIIHSGKRQKRNRPPRASSKSSAQRTVSISNRYSGRAFNCCNNS